MDCISPPEPEDRLLMAFLDGETDPELMVHLQRCPSCRARVEALAREQKHLITRLFRSTCPSATELGEYHFHLLPPERMLMISQHLRDCPYCARELNQMEEFIGNLTPGQDRSLLQQTKLLVAHLVGRQGESGVGQPSFALRGVDQGPTIFEADGVVVVVDLQSTNNGSVNILGQVAADGQEQWTGAKVNLLQTNGMQKTAVLDDLGAFRFEEAPSGPVQITIISPHGIEVRIPKIDLTI